MLACCSCFGWQRKTSDIPLGAVLCFTVVFYTVATRGFIVQQFSPFSKAGNYSTTAPLSTNPNTMSSTTGNASIETTTPLSPTLTTTVMNTTATTTDDLNGNSSLTTALSTSSTSSPSLTTALSTSSTPSPSLTTALSTSSTSSPSSTTALSTSSTSSPGRTVTNSTILTTAVSSTSDISTAATSSLGTSLSTALSTAVGNTTDLSSTSSSIILSSTTTNFIRDPSDLEGILDGIDELTDYTFLTHENSRTFFLVLAAVFILLLCFGLGLLEAGALSSRNATTIFMKTLLLICVSAILYYLFGWAIAFGEPSNVMLGYGEFALIGLSEKIGFSKWIFHCSLAAAVTVIFSGALAERATFLTYFLTAVWINVLIYPFVSHWVWSETGFLYASLDYVRFFKDYAGSGAIHICAGASALTGTIYLGARINRFKQTYSISVIPHSTPLIAVGGFFAILGLLIKNAAFTAAQDLPPGAINVAWAFINSILAGACSCLIVYVNTRFLSCWRTKKPWCLLTGINAALAGIVSASAGCDEIPFWAAILIGFGAAFIYLWFCQLLVFFKVDDPIDTIAVHFGCGIWGVLAVPIFLPEGIIFTGTSVSFIQLGWNVVGAIAIIVWCSLVLVPVVWCIKANKNLRVEAYIEHSGLDSTHGDFAYNVEMGCNHTLYPQNPSGFDSVSSRRGLLQIQQQETEYTVGSLTGIDNRAYIQDEQAFPSRGSTPTHPPPTVSADEVFRELKARIQASKQKTSQTQPQYLTTAHSAQIIPQQRTYRKRLGRRPTTSSKPLDSHRYPRTDDTDSSDSSSTSSPTTDIAHLPMAVPKRSHKGHGAEVVVHPPLPSSSSATPSPMGRFPVVSQKTATASQTDETQQTVEKQLEEPATQKQAKRSVFVKTQFGDVEILPSSSSSATPIGSPALPKTPVSRYGVRKQQQPVKSALINFGQSGKQQRKPEESRYVHFEPPSPPPERSSISSVERSATDSNNDLDEQNIAERQSSSIQLTNQSTESDSSGVIDAAQIAEQATDSGPSGPSGYSVQPSAAVHAGPLLPDVKIENPGSSETSSSELKENDTRDIKRDANVLHGSESADDHEKLKNENPRLKSWIREQRAGPVEGRFTMPDAAPVEGPFTIPDAALMEGRFTIPDAALVEGQFIIPYAALVEGRITIPDAAPVEGRFTIPDAALVEGRFTISDAAPMEGRFTIPDAAQVEGQFTIPDIALVEGRFTMPGAALVEGRFIIPDAAPVEGRFTIPDAALVEGQFTIPDAALVEGRFTITDAALVEGRLTIPDAALVEGPFTIPDAAPMEGRFTTPNDALVEGPVIRPDMVSILQEHYEAPGSDSELQSNHGLVVSKGLPYDAAAGPSQRKLKEHTLHYGPPEQYEPIYEKLPPFSHGQLASPEPIHENLPPSSHGQLDSPESIHENLPPPSHGQLDSLDSIHKNLPPSSHGQLDSPEPINENLPPSSHGQLDRPGQLKRYRRPASDTPTPYPGSRPALAKFRSPVEPLVPTPFGRMKSRGRVISPGLATARGYEEQPEEQPQIEHSDLAIHGGSPKFRYSPEPSKKRGELGFESPSMRQIAKSDPSFDGQLSPVEEERVTSPSNISEQDTETLRVTSPSNISEQDTETLTHPESSPEFSIRPSRSPFVMLRPDSDDSSENLEREIVVVQTATVSVACRTGIAEFTFDPRGEYGREDEMNI